MIASDESACGSPWSSKSSPPAEATRLEVCTVSPSYFEYWEPKPSSSGSSSCSVSIAAYISSKVSGGPSSPAFSSRSVRENSSWALVVKGTP